MRPRLTLTLVLALLGTGACGSKTPPPTKCPEPKTAEVELPEETPEDVARRYVRAVSEAELDQAAALVNGRAVVFESGQDRGLWRDYREKILGPQLGEYQAFEIWSGEASTILSVDKTLAVVTLPIEYQVTYLGGKKVQRSGSVTFGVALVRDTYQIVHLHWSAFTVDP